MDDSEVPLWLFLALACSDYAINPSATAGTGTGGSGTGPTGSGSGSTTPSTGSELRPCRDGELVPEPLDQDASCSFEEVVGTFTPVMEWANSQVGDAYTTPVVGNLTDDNGDGLIDVNDVPDVAVGSGSGATYVVSGDDGRTLWSAGNLGAEPMTPALADVDGDGRPDVVSAGVGGIEARDGATGALKWSSGAFTGATTSQCGAVGVYDLDADGTVEVVVGNLVLDGASGRTEWQGGWGEGSGHGWAAPMGLAADVNADGKLEVVTGNALYKHDGSLLWYNGEKDAFVAIADFDGDAQGEIAATAVGDVWLTDDDGQVLWKKSRATGSTSGPPTVADFDGDGEPEIGVAGQGSYTVFDTDGAVLWSKSTNDYSSGFTGSSVFDFEGDGQAEVVYADENDVWVYDGATGRVKLQESRHSSATCSEYPAIADVDNDGAAEIIYTSSAYSGNERGVRVIGDKDGSWRPARPVWNQHGYGITNINDDLSVPKNPARNWDSYNNFRSGDVYAGQGGDSPDLVAEIVEVCRDECDQGRLVVWVRAGNAGMSDVTEEVDITLYGDVGAGQQALLSTSFTGIAMGMWTEGVRFKVDADGLADLVVKVDGGNSSVGRVGECYEDNDEDAWLEDLCP